MRDLMSNAVSEEPVPQEATGTFHYQELIESRLGQPIAAEILAAEATRVALSAGTKLASARNTLGWTVEQVAAQLKLATRQIIALETDDYASLPEPAIVRGFVRAYAKLVKLDADALVTLVEIDKGAVKVEKANVRLRSQSVLSVTSRIFKVVFLIVLLVLWFVLTRY
jgi:cytoskeletal protein RodZ